MVLRFLVYELSYRCTWSHRDGTARALSSVLLATVCFLVLLGELDRDLALSVLFQMANYVV